MLNNKNFYPTPPLLAAKMLAKVDGVPSRVLEPSAGKGDLVETMKKKWAGYWGGCKIDFSCMEIDPELQATLRGKGLKLINSDFLFHSAPDQFDLIIANPPFDNGEKHLLKAIDMMYRGQIVFLLNAETLKNPYTNERRLLVQKLSDLNADIEYLQNQFAGAERPTGVEIALIYIKIEKEIEEDLFADMDDKAKDVEVEKLGEQHEISTGKTVEELVLEYNRTVSACVDTIMTFYKTSRHAGNYLSIDCDEDTRASRCDTGETLTNKVKKLINTVLGKARNDYWRRVLNLKEVHSRLTEKKRKEFEEQMTTQGDMDFTEDNIRQFVLNLIGSYEQTLAEAVVDIFDKLSAKHAWHEELHNKNVHYFNGWKTNSAFKVNRRVVVPIHASYGNPFRGFSGWQLDYQARQQLHDIDLVMNYFDGRNFAALLSLSDAIEQAFAKEENKGESTYFKFVCYKKGTIHLTFKDLDILRRFNVVACRQKGWLPQDYGSRGYAHLSAPEKAVVDAFEENVKSYEAAVEKPLFAAKELLQLSAA